MKRLTTFLIIFLTVFACTNEDTIAPILEEEETTQDTIDTTEPQDTTDTTIVTDGTLNFGNLELGGELLFISFLSDCTSFGDSFRFTGDTLSWKVTQMENGEAVLHEKYTQHPSIGNPNPVDIAIRYTDDYILMPDRSLSNLFFFYGNDTLHVNPTPAISVDQLECSFYQEDDIFDGNDIALAREVNIENYIFNEMTVVSCVPDITPGVDNAYIIYRNGNIYAIIIKPDSYDLVFGWLAT